MFETLLLGVTASVIANLLFLIGALRRRLRQRQLHWFWGPLPNNRARITFSLIRDLDDPTVFRTRRTVTHIGDAQAAVLVHSFLCSDLRAEAHLVTEEAA